MEKDMSNETKTNSSSEKMYKKVRKKERTVTSIKLDGRTALLVERIVKIIEVVYELNPRTMKRRREVSKTKVDEKKENFAYLLREITEEDLSWFREREVPSFVLKDGDKLYHTTIPDDISLISNEILGVHCCAMDCQRALALSDEQGGCKKVRDRGSNKQIEKYAFIRLGYETFSTKHDAFVVVECEQYQKAPDQDNKKAE